MVCLIVYVWLIGYLKLMIGRFFWIVFGLMGRNCSNEFWYNNFVIVGFKKFVYKIECLWKV